MPATSDLQYLAVYIVLSFSLAAGWQQPYIFSSVHLQSKTIQECRLHFGLVTFIAAHHYFRILILGCLGDDEPHVDRKFPPFHDAYRHLD